MKIEVQVHGIKEVAALLGKVKLAMDADSIADEASAMLLNRIRTRFLRQTSPEGKVWPVSRAAMIRKQKGIGGGTLFDTGALFHSLEVVRGPKGERILRVNPETKNKKGTLVESYARTHQLGLKGMPKRVFLGFSKDDESMAVAIIRTRLREVLQ